eukprot:735900-Prymnesium_polylepis.1
MADAERKMCRRGGGEGNEITVRWRNREVWNFRTQCRNTCGLRSKSTRVIFHPKRAQHGRNASTIYSVR